MGGRGKLKCGEKKPYSQLGLGAERQQTLGVTVRVAWRAFGGSTVRESRGQNGIKAFLDLAHPRLFGLSWREKNNSVKIIYPVVFSQRR